MKRFIIIIILLLTSLLVFPKYLIDGNYSNNKYSYNVDIPKECKINSETENYVKFIWQDIGVGHIQAIEKVGDIEFVYNKVKYALLKVLPEIEIAVEDSVEMDGLSAKRIIYSFRQGSSKFTGVSNFLLYSDKILFHIYIIIPKEKDNLQTAEMLNKWFNSFTRPIKKEN